MYVYTTHRSHMVFNERMVSANTVSQMLVRLNAPMATDESSHNGCSPVLPRAKMTVIFQSQSHNISVALGKRCCVHLKP